jgi:hypothetical protein
MQPCADWANPPELSRSNEVTALEAAPAAKTREPSGETVRLSTALIPAAVAQPGVAAAVRHPGSSGGWVRAPEPSRSKTAIALPWKAPA